MENEVEVGVRALFEVGPDSAPDAEQVHKGV